MTSADELQPATTIHDMCHADLLAHYIALTQQILDCDGTAGTELRDMRAQARDVIIERMGLSTAMSFINGVEGARRE